MRIGPLSSETWGSPRLISTPQAMARPRRTRRPPGSASSSRRRCCGGRSSSPTTRAAVVPDGRHVGQVANRTLGQPAAVDLTVPPEAIEGSARAVVKIYPSSFSQLSEGLDNIFHLPSGCFEQTSSTTYPNVLALD